MTQGLDENATYCAGVWQRSCACGEPFWRERLYTMLGFVRKKFPDNPTFAVMADTGFEHVFPISAADFARARCAEFGFDLTVVRNPKRTYLEMVEQRAMMEVNINVRHSSPRKLGNLVLLKCPLVVNVGHPPLRAQKIAVISIGNVGHRITHWKRFPNTA